MASGRINGVVTGDNASRKYQFWVEWSSQPNVANGTSVVQANAYVQRTDGYSASAYNNDISAGSKRLTIDGTAYTSGSNGIDTRNGRKVLIASGSKTVTHNANGYRNVTITASFPRVASSLTGGSLSGTVSLGYIDMSAPTLTVTVTGSTPTSVTLRVTSNAALSDIQYRVIGLRGWVSVGAGSSKAITVTGLSPNTAYSFELWGKKQSNGKEVYKTVTGKTGITRVTGITLQSDTLSVGEKKSYTPVIIPSGASIRALTYKPSNPSVAVLQTETGESYTVLAKSVGTTTITATATDGSGVTGTCTITVTQPVQGLTIAADSLYVPVGGSVQLEYTVLPADATDKSVTIVSNDETVATVSGNTVIGVGNGVTTVVLTTKDGGFTASVQVFVQGSFVWYDYPVPLDILNAADVQQISANMSALRGLILLTGEQVDEFAPINAQVNTPYRSMRGLLQSIEDNLTALNATPYKSGYYVGHVTVGAYATDRAGIWRWLQTINDIYHILAGDVGMWQALLCTDGYPTIDGEHILVRGEIYILWQTLLCSDGYPTIDGNHINIRGDLIG